MLFIAVPLVTQVSTVIDLGCWQGPAALVIEDSVFYVSARGLTCSLLLVRYPDLATSLGNTCMHGAAQQASVVPAAVGGCGGCCGGCGGCAANK